MANFTTGKAAPTKFSRVDAGEWIDLTPNSNTPDETARRFVYVDGSDVLKYWNGSSSISLLGGGGSGAAGSLDSAYDISPNITIDSGALQLADATAGALNTFEIVKTGAGSGSLIDLSVDAALTGKAIAIDMNLGIAAVCIYIDNGATARTGADIQVNDDSTGNHSIIDINASGSGETVGFDFTGSYAGNGGGQAIKVTLDANDNLTTEIMKVTTGAGNRGIMFDLNFGHADSGTTSHIFDIDVTGILDSNIFDFATTAACTGNVFFIDLDTAVAMTAISIEGSGVRTQPFIELISDCTGAANMIQLTASGAFTGDFIALDMNAAVGANAIFLDAGASTRTAPLILTTFDGDGTTTGGTLWDINVTNTGGAANPLFDIDVTGVYTGNIFDVAMGAAATGHVLNVDMNLNLAGSFLVLDYGGGLRTEDMCQVTYDGTGTTPFWDINISNTGAGGTSDYWDIDVSGVFTGSILDVTYSAAATGDCISLNLTSAVDIKAMYLVAAGARTDDVFEINDSSTGNSHTFDINFSGIYTGNCLDITYASAAATGNAIDLNMGTNIGGNAIDINLTGARTGVGILFTDDSTGNAPCIDMNFSGIRTGNAIDITYATAAATENAIDLNMGTNLAGKAIDINLTGIRTGAGVLITDDSTGNAPIFDLNISGIRTGNAIDITYATAAATENAIDLNMGTNVAGHALDIASAGTGDGCIMTIAHTGNLASGSGAIKISSTGNYAAADGNLVELTQATGAGQAGNNVLYISATGTNVEAIEVAAGKVYWATQNVVLTGNDETVTSTANVVFVDPDGGSRTGLIVAAGLRDGEHIKLVNIADAAENITMAVAGTSNVSVGTDLVIGQNEAVELVWNTATSLWYPLITVFS